MSDEPNIIDRPDFDDAFIAVILQESLANFAVTEDDVEIVFEECWYKGDLTPAEMLEIAHRANQRLMGLLEVLRRSLPKDRNSPSLHILRDGPLATHLRETIKKQNLKRRKK